MANIEAPHNTSIDIGYQELKNLIEKNPKCHLTADIVFRLLNLHEEEMVNKYGLKPINKPIYYSSSWCGRIDISNVSTFIHNTSVYKRHLIILQTEEETNPYAIKMLPNETDELYMKRTKAYYNDIVDYHNKMNIKRK